MSPYKILFFLLLSALTVFASPLYAEDNTDASFDSLAKDADKLLKDTGTLVQDTTITASVSAKLALDKNVSHYPITVNTQNGVVSLSGTVNAQSEAAAVVALASSTAGVKAVNASKLEIQASTHPLSDTEITTKVKALFLKQNMFGEKDASTGSVSVETNNGVVYLSGTAENSEQVDNAIKLANSVSGVKNVKSTIVVLQK
jgi:hyperosmotically inducible protein